MTSVGVLQSDGTVCRTGPSCRRHGAAVKQATLVDNIRALLAPEASEQAEAMGSSVEPVAPVATKPAPPYAVYLPGLSKEQYVAFTEGDCWILAKAVQDITDYPIVVAGHAEDDLWCHMGNLAPDGSVWDANGRHENTETFLAKWADYIESNFSDFGKPGVPTVWTVEGREHWQSLTEDQDRMYEDYDAYDVAPMIAEAAKVHSKN